MNVSWVNDPQVAQTTLKLKAPDVLNGTERTHTDLKKTATLLQLVRSLLDEK